MMLDLHSFQGALESLRRGIERARRVPEDEEVRDAVIQRFEYSFELAWKMLKRRLELDSPHPIEIDHLSYRGLIREGAERGFIENVERWMQYPEARNITVPAYDPEKTGAVFRTAFEFL